MSSWLDTVTGRTALLVGASEGLAQSLATRFERVFVAQPGRALSSPRRRPLLGEGEIVYLAGQDAYPDQIDGPLDLIVLAFTLGRQDNLDQWLAPWPQLLAHQGRLALLEWYPTPAHDVPDNALHRQLLETLANSSRVRMPNSRELVKLLQKAGLVHVRQETQPANGLLTQNDIALLAAEGLRELTALALEDDTLSTALREKSSLIPGPVITAYGAWKQLPEPVEEPASVEEGSTGNEILPSTENGAAAPAASELDNTLPDLLATVLRSHTSSPRETAEHLLRAFGSRALAQLGDATQIMDETGLPLEGALHLVSVLRLARHLHSPTLDVEIHGPEDAWQYLSPEMATLTREHFRGLYLNVKGRIVVDEVISIGTLTSALVHPREVFGPAIENACHSVLIAHNHPSGDPTPSMEDIHLTRELAEAGRLLNIELLDHIVIGSSGYVSLKEKRHF